MSFTLICNKKYLLLPTVFDATPRRLLFYEGDRLVFDLVAGLEFDRPEITFPVDISRFKGKTLRLECEDIDGREFVTTDEPALDYSGSFRPLAHFAAQRGWINDPNGLVYADGRYLMYYQHNPAAITWENMHWGSAESSDLIHWTEKGDVLFPDENGTIFSGSGIVDKKNVSGLKKGEKDVILFFYTCAGGTSKTSAGKSFTQRLAYSLDGGKTLVKYDKPVIDHIAGENRDPKVIYYEPDDAYILALYLEKDDFALFKSKNLLDWKEIQRFTLPEDNECPDFYPLMAPDGQEKWVFTAAHDRYYIGTFDGRHFRPELPEGRLHFGNGSYAAQSWSGLPGGRRVRTAFAGIVIPGQPFGGCHDIPQEMSLKIVNGGLKLCAEPVKEIESLYKETVVYENVSVTDNQPFSYKVNSRANDVKIDFMANRPLKISFFGRDIVYDPETEVMSCGECTATVVGESGVISLRIICDTCYTEIFADEGSVYMGMDYRQDVLQNTFKIESSDTKISKIRINELKAFYK